MTIVVLLLFIFAVFLLWYFLHPSKSQKFVERKEHDQRFPVKDKHLKIWRD